MLEWTGTEFVGAIPETALIETQQNVSGNRLFLAIATLLGIVSIVGISIVLRSGNEAEQKPENSPLQAINSTEQGDSNDKDVSGSVGQNAQTNVTVLLQGIHKKLSDYQNQHGQFPNGSSQKAEESNASWSWIAELHRDGFDDGVLPVWEHGWNAPSNQSFVRRRLDTFRNPSINQLAGDDRYPTTHFAGLTGVGPDSETLPARHPRAGVFSEVRTTRLSDVLDGTANTILIVGVQDHLGSWARPDSATMRGFRSEPYVNGPDGIGTGQADSMFVLMVDGSVRKISQKIDPKIARRMATIADGMSLDPTTPGDPLLADFPGEKEADEKEPVPETQSLTTSEQTPTEDQEPITPEESVRQRLKQRVAGYSVASPVEVGKLLYEFQELAAVRVETEGLTESQLATEITVDAGDVSLNELLEILVAKAGLQSEIAESSIRIVAGESPEVN